MATDAQQEAPVEQEPKKRPFSLRIPRDGVFSVYHGDIQGITKAGRAEDDSDAVNASKRAVYTAIGSNMLVTAAKFSAFAVTQSGSMFAESIHSMADVFNQMLLALGIHRSEQPANERHPYGRAPEQFAWALVSGVGIFFLGCGVSVYHGIDGILNPSTVESIPIALGVLGLSALADGYSMWAAIRAIRIGAARHKMTMKEYVVRGPDPMAVGVLMEDAVALAGVTVAATCLGLTYWTGNSIYDAAGSVVVGGLLGAVAVFLIRKNIDSLAGRAIERHQQVLLQQKLNSDPVVKYVHSIKAVTMGPSAVRLNAEIAIDSWPLASAFVHTNKRQLLQQLEQCDTEEKKALFLKQYGSALVDSLGYEVDRLEKIIQDTIPEVKYVDLEFHGEEKRR